jgi:hypothetical protein
VARLPEPTGDEKRPENILTTPPQKPPIILGNFLFSIQISLISLPCEKGWKSEISYRESGMLSKREA